MDGAGVPGAGVVGAVLSFFERRGGWSVVSIPRGTLSAFIPPFGASVPTGSHMPVPSHGVTALTALLCRAPFRVNNPTLVPVRSPSYTVPDSRAMGTGFAL